MRSKEKRDTYGSGGGGGYSSRKDYQDEGYRYALFILNVNSFPTVIGQNNVPLTTMFS